MARERRPLEGRHRRRDISRCGFHRPKLGDKEAAGLTAKKDFRHWRDAIAKALPRIRTRVGDKQKYRPIDEDANDEGREDEQRKRRATVNRTWTTLRAALNKAFENDKVATDAGGERSSPKRARTRPVCATSSCQTRRAW